MKFTSVMPLCSGTFRMERVDAEKLATLLAFEQPTLTQIDPNLRAGLQALAPEADFTEGTMRLAPFDSFVFLLSSVANRRVPTLIYIVHYDHIENAIDDPLWVEIDGANTGTPLLLAGGIEFAEEVQP